MAIYQLAKGKIRIENKLIKIKIYPFVYSIIFFTAILN